jgi:hypothetical protein
MLAVSAVSALVVFAVFYVAWTQYTVAVRTTELSRQTVALASGLSAGGPLTDGDTTSDGIRQQLFRVQASLIGAMSPESSTSRAAQKARGRAA